MRAKTTACLTSLLAFVALAQPVAAKTNVSEKIEQLKENSANSRENLKQYEENLKVVTENLNENAKALKSLEKQKQSLEKTKTETVKGKVGVTAVKKQLEGFLTSEQQKLEAEKKQIAELQKTLETLQQNQVKREANIAEYQQKLTTVEAEMMSWAERGDSINELETAIREKEKEALADRKQWTDKKATYEEEVSKWRKQVRVSERQYDNFSKLKD